MLVVAVLAICMRRIDSVHLHARVFIRACAMYIYDTIVSFFSFILSVCRDEIVKSIKNRFTILQFHMTG